MPELPETETIARDLHSAITGRTIQRVVVHRPDVLREITPRTLATRLRGVSIVRCWRRAKLVLLDLATGDRIVVQPRFTGALLLDGGALPEQERRFSTVELTLPPDLTLHYRDIRRLGTVSLMSPGRWTDYERRLGIEPLDPSFTDSYLSALLRGSSQPVKKLLMDQRRLAGLGNIYANESLWRARIDPSRRARSLSADETRTLHAAIQGVLAEAIESRGTSFRDYRDATGSRGDFAARLAAYGRGGEPCTRCGARLVETHAVDGRSTVLCVRCQR
ncbi:MAG: bifunctional DNA-formamidopyrimidine glycosylase/DNA-(apurinic or apyrimidinic site) lyase [Gemmatimonadaceae bacterium]